MNTRDLHYLVTLAELGHFGKAAAACFVSQPALSMQIKKLETTLGVKLLERTNKSVFLTDAGILIAKHAQQILNQVDELREVAKSLHDPFSGVLRLGIFPTLAPYLMPYIMPPLAKEFPKVSFVLVEEKTDILFEKLRAGKLHAAIVALSEPESGLVSSLLFEEDFLLTVSHTHPFASKKSITQDELCDKKFLLLDDGHCMRSHVMEFCQQMHSQEDHNFRATSLETLRHMVAAGAGITLMPKLSSVGCELATFIPFDKPRPYRSICLVRRVSSTKNILLNEVEKKIKSIMTKNKLVKVVD